MPKIEQDMTRVLELHQTLCVRCVGTHSRRRAAEFLFKGFSMCFECVGEITKRMGIASRWTGPSQYDYLPDQWPKEMP